MTGGYRANIADALRRVEVLTGHRADSEAELQAQAAVTNAHMALSAALAFLDAEAAT